MLQTMTLIYFLIDITFVKAHYSDELGTIKSFGHQDLCTLRPTNTKTNTTAGYTCPLDSDVRSNGNAHQDVIECDAGKTSLDKLLSLGLTHTHTHSNPLK